jgi:tRNA nucleotidyltransferase (CCA-adding enzyme)
MNLLNTMDEVVVAIVKKIAECGGRAFLVGGAVRDYILHLPLKDVDIEVHNMQPAVLQTILEDHGIVNMVGKSFGVLRLYGLDVDWSLPRTDSIGRKPDVVINPTMTFKEAARRRDLTINAMGIDLMSDELIDPFKGREDSANKTLRCVDRELFAEDPLRFFRVMQFIGRFEMEPDKDLNKLCSTISLDGVSRERIEEEFKKLLLLSRRPSLGIRWLHKVGRLRHILPELADTVGVEQNPVWHPEGDVFEHSMQALDAAADIANAYDDNTKKLTLLYAALCHDLGKVVATRLVNGTIKSIGHEDHSKPLAIQMMKRITENADLIKTVATMALHHMAPFLFVGNNAGVAAYKRLAHKIKGVCTLRFLADLSLADKRGRNGELGSPLTIDFPQLETFKERAQMAGVLDGCEKPLVTGADLLHIVNPGAELGRILQVAYEMQINDSIKDKDLLIEKVIKYYVKRG